MICRRDCHTRASWRRRPRVELRARLHFRQHVERPPLSIDDERRIQDFMTAAELLEQREAAQRARQARNLARLLRQPASQQDNE